MPSLWLRPFDPHADFVAIRMFRLSGKILKRGAPIEKDALTPRKLEQLYRTRFIGIAGDEQVRSASTKKVSRAAGANELADAEATPVEEPVVDPGDVARAPETLEERASVLAEQHRKPDLLKLAEGIDGVSNSMTKQEIAEAIVKAGDGAP